MQGPWEKYKPAPPAESGPWQKYAKPTEAAAPRGVMDSVSDFGKGVINAVNPIPGLQALYQEGPVGVVKGMAEAQGEQFTKAKQAFDSGDYVTALRYTAGWLIPMLGPGISAAGDKMQEGKYAEAMGEATGIAAGTFAPVALKGRGPTLRVKSRLNPVEAEAVAFAEVEGVPIDAATRTGNPMVRASQNLLQKQPGGSGYAQAARQKQADALANVGNRLVEKVVGKAETPETAGRAVTGSLEQRIASLKRKADVQYARLREIGKLPENQREIEVGRTTEAIKSLYEEAIDDSISMRLAGVKDLVDSGQTELTGKAYRGSDGKVEGRFGGGFKILFPELKNFPEQPGVIAKAIAKKEGPLYTRLREAFRDTVIDEESLEIRNSLERQGISLDIQDVNTKTVPITEKLPLPVDLRSAKTALRPVFEEMRQSMPLSQRQASVGLQAIENILNGPDLLPASVADKNLGAVKSILRGARSENLRNVSQGLAARAVRELDAAVQKGVASAGPKASQALTRGRILTKEKYAVADLADTLKKEPVEVYRQLTANKDAHVDLLRQVAKNTPDEMPKIGRAYLEGLLEDATKEGGFDKAGTLSNRWASLGPETKKVLFKNPSLVEDLDKFFLAAKRIAENPNPSGTASTAAVLGTAGLMLTSPAAGGAFLLGNAGLARLLFSPAGSRALLRGLKIPLGNIAATTSAVNQILSMAGKGNAVPVPAR